MDGHNSASRFTDIDGRKLSLAAGSKFARVAPGDPARYTLFVGSDLNDNRYSDVQATRIVLDSRVAKNSPYCRGVVDEDGSKSQIPEIIARRQVVEATAAPKKDLGHKIQI